MGSPLASFITPTLNRPDTHAALYATFAAQTYEPRMLHVLDESQEPSPFFSQLQDARVDYVHAPMTGKREVTRIGAARNTLCERAKLAGATFILHVDDDDWYSPDYAETMISKLGDADIAKLAVFRLIVEKGEAAGTLWQWDVRSMGGKHYGLRGDAAPQETQIGHGEEPEYAEAVRYGFGFSLVYRISLHDRFKFPEEGTEDYPWVRTCLDGGAKLVEVDDFSHGCIHTVSIDSQSMVFPQTKLSPGVGSEARSVRQIVRWRMLGEVQGMYELPKDKDIQAKPGVTYSVLSSIKSNHTLKSVTTRAETWGLHVTEARDNVSPDEFGVPAPENGYRLVHIAGTTDKPIRIPWKTNKLISLFDKSQVVRAWSSEPVGVGSPQINAQLEPAQSGWSVRPVPRRKGRR